MTAAEKVRRAVEEGQFVGELGAIVAELVIEAEQSERRLRGIASKITPMRERFRARKGTTDEIRLCIADRVALEHIEALSQGREPKL